MDEQVREWMKKKMQKISKGESVLEEPSPEPPKVEEEPAVEKEMVERETEVKQQPEARQQPEIKQPIETEQPIKGSVDVEEKISEYVQEVTASAGVKEPAVEGSDVEELQRPELQTPKMPVYRGINDFPRVTELSESRLGLFNNRKIFNKRRMLILIISSVAGLVAGLLLVLFLIS